MTGEVLIVLAGAVVSVTLYYVAYRQLRREIPERAALYLGEALLTAIGASLVAGLRGFGPVMWATAPAFVAAAAFVASKGSIPVLLREGEKGEEVPVETARARTRFGVIIAVSMIVLFIAVFTAN